jgi:hypothetical protein
MMVMADAPLGGEPLMDSFLDHHGYDAGEGGDGVDGPPQAPPGGWERAFDTDGEEVRTYGSFTHGATVVTY